MTRQLISSGSSFEQEIGYSRAVVDGDWIFVSGCSGFNYATMTIVDDLPGQTDQAMRNVEAALTQAGASLRDIVRVLYVIVDAKEFSQCWPVLRKYLGDVRPAAMMISAGLLDPRMRIEIEVTARRPSATLPSPIHPALPAADIATTGQAARPPGGDEIVMGDET